MRRNITDKILNALTYLASLISVFILGAIVIYLVQQGSGLLSWDLITSNYHATSFKGSVAEDYQYQSMENNYSGDGYYSEKWGIAVIDTYTTNKEDVIEVDYIDPNSPFNDLISTVSGEDNQLLSVDVGTIVTNLYYLDENNEKVFLSPVKMQDAANLISVLDSEAFGIVAVSFQTIGGGIWGSVIVTLMLILISVVIALPIGIASAIYLNEYAKKNTFNQLLRNGIETLTGVPSIIYGLMGIAVLFPITQLFGATSTSVLLGALTLVVILLPTIIRSTEEALLVVPQALRDGSLSLGATKSQTIFKVVLPCAVNGILTGVLLSIGRVIGESAALVYTTSTVINDAPELLGQGTSLSLMIWTLMSGEQPNFELASAISLIILIIVLVLNIGVKLIGRKFAKSLG